jgi:hypothetical protein
MSKLTRIVHIFNGFSEPNTKLQTAAEMIAREITDRWLGDD